jgi:Tol biopolymer transport system component
MRGLILGALVAASCVAPATPSPTPSATTASTPAGSVGSPTAAATTAPGPSAQPSVSAVLSVNIIVIARPVNVPAEFRYVDAGEQSQRRLLLVDVGTGVVTQVLSVSVGPSGQATFSTSSDGRRILVAAGRPDARTVIALVDVETGAVRGLFEDVALGDYSELGAVLSPDGTRYAFATIHDLRVGDTAGGPPHLVAAHDDPNKVGGSWGPAGWSPDGKWLALSRSSEGFSEMAIVDTTTNAIRRLGTGTDAAWRPRAPMPTPELVVASGVNAFGGSTAIYTYDIQTNRGSVLQNGGSQRIGSLMWHPAADRFLYTAGVFGPPGDDVLIWRLGDASPSKIASSRKVISAWWSRDGSKIYGVVIRQDALATAPGVANYEVIDVASGAVVATVCRGDPRAACP